MLNRIQLHPQIQCCNAGLSKATRREWVAENHEIKRSGCFSKTCVPQKLKGLAMSWVRTSSILPYLKVFQVGSEAEAYTAEGWSNIPFRGLQKCLWDGISESINPSNPFHLSVNERQHGIKAVGFCAETPILPILPMTNSMAKSDCLHATNNWRKA